jgi:hypothetical protein
MPHHILDILSDKVYLETLLGHTNTIPVKTGTISSLCWRVGNREFYVKTCSKIAEEYTIENPQFEQEFGKANIHVKKDLKENQLYYFRSPLAYYTPIETSIVNSANTEFNCEIVKKWNPDTYYHNTEPRYQCLKKKSTKPTANIQPSPRY